VSEERGMNLNEAIEKCERWLVTAKCSRSLYRDPDLELAAARFGFGVNISSYRDHDLELAVRRLLCVLAEPVLCQGCTVATGLWCSGCGEQMA